MFQVTVQWYFLVVQLRFLIKFTHSYFKIKPFSSVIKPLNLAVPRNLFFAS